ncbi:50S ribosomal protein L18 [Candidatus Daviesbacteria bacterium RIFCSPLOWO2_02_FULL_36_8]|uniref:Large ribosomal subunit protein uL18 n=1 Tax=Candidatus Daviesbacteria bacterium RIFCSPLOWO2_02_FULL_36_8 TaxID=1797793 RepID=A0A1F5MFI5_9BACT|nr:MAG: 50S ribosomal protein L18 [Candidatus Daviesbacteria bacterium RIFCSPLOWO2_02_FULL_36_8]HLC37725.1 50S ribosomal protein L18 [Candidatus Nanoarchaeia archaeon]
MQKETRLRKHMKIRKYLNGTSDRPRLSVFRSIQHISAQIIDDSKGKTLVFATDEKQKGTGGAKLTKKEKAYNVGKDLAEKALKLKIKMIVFDRGGFLYQGRVEELAKGAREGGLDF